jgi:hypothetical protein
LKEDHKLQKYENKTQNTVFGGMKDEESRQFKGLHNKELLIYKGHLLVRE